MMKVLGSLAACAMLVTGCSSEREYDAYDGNYEEFNVSSEDFQEFQAYDASISGDIGSMRDMNSDATVFGYDEGNYATVEVLTENENGAAMHWLEIYGGIDHPALRPGSSFSFVQGDYPTRANQLFIQAMGCSGDAAYEWDMDEAAQVVNVEVSEGDVPESIRIDYTTEVPNTVDFTQIESDVSSGSFILQR